MSGGELQILTIKDTLPEGQLVVKALYLPLVEVSSASVNPDVAYIGTDVAGSVRVPAHFSGIYTIKCRSFII
jgi:hypothetical protein